MNFFFLYCCLCKNVYFKFMSVVSYLKSVFFFYLLANVLPLNLLTNLMVEANTAH